MSNLNEEEIVKRVKYIISGLYEALDYPENQKKQEYIDNINYDIDGLERNIRTL